MFSSSVPEFKNEPSSQFPPPSPLTVSSSDFKWFSNYLVEDELFFDQEMAGDVNDFASLFLEPTNSGGGSVVPSKPGGCCLSKMLIEPLHTPTNFQKEKEEPMRTLKVPQIPATTPIDVTSPETYFSRSCPDVPGSYVTSKPAITKKPVTQQLRSQRPDKPYVPCASDGVLFSAIMEGMKSNKIILSTRSAAELKKRRDAWKHRRSSARTKLEAKRLKWKNAHFAGHYPTRKKVATSRKRIGGRFVKENKAVFVPVQELSS